MVLYKECIISGKHKALCIVRKEESVIKKRKDWIGSKAKKKKKKEDMETLLN